jgi:hypothetical protein
MRIYDKVEIQLNDDPSKKTDFTVTHVSDEQISLKSLILGDIYSVDLFFGLPTYLGLTQRTIIKHEQMGRDIAQFNFEMRSIHDTRIVTEYSTSLTYDDDHHPDGERTITVTKTLSHPKTLIAPEIYAERRFKANHIYMHSATEKQFVAVDENRARLVSTKDDDYFTVDQFNDMEQERNVLLISSAFSEFTNPIDLDVNSK